MEQRGLESAADRDRVLFELTRAGGIDVFEDESGVFHFRPYVLPDKHRRK
jgi:prophage regulatory protein